MKHHAQLKYGTHFFASWLKGCLLTPNHLLTNDHNCIPNHLDQPECTARTTQLMNERSNPCKLIVPPNPDANSLSILLKMFAWQAPKTSPQSSDNEAALGGAVGSKSINTTDAHAGAGLSVPLLISSLSIVNLQRSGQAYLAHNYHYMDRTKE